MALSHYLLAAGGGYIHRFHLLNNGREIINNVFRFSNSLDDCNNSKNSIITNCWNRLHTSENLSLPILSSSSSWSLLDARKITETNTGKKIVCALLCSVQLTQLLFVIVTTTCDYKTIIPLKYVKVRKQSFEVLSSKVRLIDGPGLMWVHGPLLCIATSSFASRLILKSYSPVEEERNNSKQLLLGTNQEKKGINPESSVSVLFYCNFQETSLVVGTKINEEKEKTNFAVVFSIPVVDSFKNVDISRVLPEPYVSTAQHVKVLEFRYNKDGYDTDKFDGGKFCFNIRLLAVTCDGYLTEFHNGKLIRCLYLSNINETGVSQLTAFRTFQNKASSCFPVLITNEYKVIVITPQLTKVHSTIEGISHVFVDDFLNEGTPQLLLAQLLPPSKCEPNQFSNRWLLTDFESCHFSSEPNILHRDLSDGVAAESLIDECPEAVKEALSHKIQLEILAMEEKAKQLMTRNEFILNGWHQLVSIPNTKEFQSLFTTDTKPGMMPFVESLSVPRISSTKKVLNSNPLEIIRVWQKIFADQWIIGVEFTYKKPNLLKNASLLITGATCSGNDVFKPETPRSNSSINHSRNSTLCGQCFFEKNGSSCVSSSQTHFTVTCALSPMPALTVDSNCKFLVLLSLNSIHEELQTMQLLTYPCGSITFSLQQMIGDTLKDSSLLQFEDTSPLEELENNLCVLNTVQHCCKVYVCSMRSNLTFLVDHLKSLKELTWNSFLKCFLWHSSHGVLANTRLYIENIQPYNCLINIFTRELSCIPALVHFLYSQLPDDVVIFPKGHISLAKVYPWLQQLESHLQILSRELYLLENERSPNEEQFSTGEFGQLTPDIVDKIRQECKAKKQKLSEGHLLVSAKCQSLMALSEKQKANLDSLAVIFYNLCVNY